MINNRITTALASEYKKDILNFLEQKYEESFVISSIVRQSDIGKADTVTARGYSRRYPNETFEVRYHLPIRDIMGEEEIINVLKEAGIYDERMLKSPDDNTPAYFEDNYSNVIYQNKFDEEYCGFDATYIKTLFKTTNYYPDLQNRSISLKEYMESDAYRLYACTMIFADEHKIGDKDIYIQKIKEKLAVSDIDLQFIYFHFTNKDSDFIKKIFFDNYDNAVAYFKNEIFLSGYENIFLKNGKERNYKD